MLTCVTFVNWLNVLLLVNGFWLTCFVRERSFVIAGVVLEATHFLLEARFFLLPGVVFFWNVSWGGFEEEGFEWTVDDEKR